MDDKKYSMIGYTHIDPVWLWNRAEGMQEVKSSFSSALERLEEFPAFKFMHTSISFLAWLKENCPDQYARIHRYVEEGRWEIAGGMWVEPDCDLPCAEALIRHFLYGKHFVKKEFGVEVTAGFNPDSFGHGANLPAVLAGCGIRYYALSRPDRGHVTLPPVFVWKAKDGSSVIAERTGGEYMAWTRPAIEFNLRESGEALEEAGYDRMAVFYGVGNHGGGPTIENIRTILEMQQEYPEGKLEFSTLGEFFETVEEKRLPVVEGELGRIYWGCYSSDREVKSLNRRAEWTLLKAEAVAAMAAGMGVSAYRYPAEKLEEAWKETLFNQFHDVLAGTSIEPARAQACREFSASISMAERLIHDGVQAIANALDTRGDGFPLILINPTGKEFCGVFAADVYVPRAQKKLLRLRDVKGAEIQHCETAYHNRAPESRKGILFEARVPAYGYAVYRMIQEGPNVENTEPAIKASRTELDNGILKVRLDERTGCPSSLQKGDCSLLESPCSVKVFYDDRGAWGETVFQEKLVGEFEAVRSYVAEQNALRAVVRVLLAWERSEMRIDYILEKGSDVLKLDVRLHNSEKHRQIDFCVPVRAKQPVVLTETAFLAEAKVRCDDSNTEHYQHRFADVSDAGGSGIAILNDSVYACAQKGNEYRLILSRSSVYARGGGGPLCEDLDQGFMDQGTWDYQLRLIPHDTVIKKSRLFAEADFLHMPVEYLGDSNHTGEKWLRTGALLKTEGENAAVSCIKQSLESPGELVLRVFETEGRGGSFTAELGENRMETQLTPWQIKTFRLTQDGFAACDMLERPVTGEDAKCGPLTDGTKRDKEE